jgi:hypothetical protein
MPAPGLTASIVLSPDLQSPRRAREFVVGVLDRWGAEEMIFRATLLVSELVTNAVIHARTPVELTVRRARGGVRLEVADASPALPHRLDVPPDALSGRASPWWTRSAGHGASSTATTTGRSSGARSTVVPR